MNLMLLAKGSAAKSAPQVFAFVILVIVVVAIITMRKKYKEAQERSKQRELDFMATYEKAMLQAKSAKQQDAVYDAESQVKVQENQEVATISMSKTSINKPADSQIETEKIDRPVKMVVLDGTALNPGDLSWKEFEKFGTITVYDRSTPEQVVDRIGDAEIVFTNKTVLTKEIFEACPSVKYVGVNATGYNVVDLEAAKDAGIIVTNIPQYGTDAVAQFTFALILELCDQVSVHNQSVQLGGWKMSPDFSYFVKPIMDLAGKTLGIVGYGAIGSKVAQIAKAFGMKVMVYSRTKKTSDPSIIWGTLDEVLAKSDIVTLHCPLTKDNELMMNANSFAKMKDGAKLINTARGGLVNEQDLVAALRSGKLSGAALDVISAEPMAQNSPLIGVENLIITPHIAWASQEARERLMKISVENLEQFLAGKPVNVVN